MTDPIQSVGSMTATWTDPTGVVWDLTDTDPDVGRFTTFGPSGWNATTYEIVTDPVQRGGESVRFIRAKPARLVWPLYVWGDSHLAWVQRHRAIRRAIIMSLHRATAGTLRVTRSEDGSAREIDCFYESGFEGQSGEGWLYSLDAITFFAPDGYWRGVDQIEVVHSYIPGSDFLDPFPTVSNSLALGENEIDNPGDVDAWPVWTITGPMTALSATNTTTGYEFTLTYPLLAGEEITITTLQPSVRGPAGQNLTSALDWPGAYLWWLAPGTNDVIFNVSGGDVGTSVKLAFHPRYEGA